MFDYETDSLWAVISGESIKGSLEGKRLNEIVSSQKITWGEWKQLHPETKVLSYNGRQTTGFDNYRDYHNSRAKTGILTVKNKDSRLKPKTTVIGLEINDEKKVYPLDLFKSNKILEDTFQNVQLLLYHDKVTNNTVVYDRNIDDKILEFNEPTRTHFERNSEIVAVDTVTNSKWDLNTGEAIDGEFKGRFMGKVNFKKVYWFIWADFYPDSKIHK